MPRWRREAEKRGIKVSLEDIYDFQGNPAGGRSQMGVVTGRATGILRLDLEKLVGLRGASIYTSGVFQSGSNLAKTYIGAWDLTSSVAGTHALRFNEYYWQQSLFQNKLTLRVGQMAAGLEFGNQAIGFDDKAASFKTWINTSMADGLPTVRQAYLSLPPAAKPALLFLVEPDRHIFAKVGLLSGSHSPYIGDESGIRFDLRDAPIVAVSLGWKSDDETKAHPGVYKIGIIHNFGNFPRFNSRALTHGNDVVFANEGYALWRARRQDGTFSHRGIDLQLSITAAPRDLNQNDFETGDGIRLVGLLPQRSSDIVAIGAIYAHFSRAWSEQLRSEGMPDRTSQTGLEVGYKFVFSRWLSLWPDFQYIWKPSGDRRLTDAPVFGMRIVFDH